MPAKTPPTSYYSPLPHRVGSYMTRVENCIVLSCPVAFRQWMDGYGVIMPDNSFPPRLRLVEGIVGEGDHFCQAVY